MIALKKDTDCYLTKDLIPLYEDQILSETSKKFVEDHIKNCKKCRKYLEDYRETLKETRQEEVMKDKKMALFFKRRRYELIGLIAGMVVMAAIAIGIFMYGVFSMGFSVKEHYDNPQDYGKQHYRGIARLSLFPDDKIEKNKIKDFYYDCDGNRLYQKYQIYVQCHYNGNEYEKEIDRLMNIVDEETREHVKYSDEENNLPCIYAMLYDEGYEYVLLDQEKNDIYYIYLQDVDRRELYFNTSLLPKNYGQKGLAIETERDAYSIYLKE